MVIAEEFGDWEDNSRRIDLLCLSKGRGPSRRQIKRTENGGHMELQAIPYAAMGSSLRSGATRAFTVSDQFFAARPGRRLTGNGCSQRKFGRAFNGLLAPVPELRISPNQETCRCG
jgi:hypothetical protein